MSKLLKLLFSYLALILLSILVLVAASKLVNAHSWYDPECCDNRDCVPVTKVEYLGHATVYHTMQYGPITITNEEMRTQTQGGVQFSIRPSQDSKYHICVITYMPAIEDWEPGSGPQEVDKEVRCLYVPGAV